MLRTLAIALVLAMTVGCTHGSVVRKVTFTQIPHCGEELIIDITPSQLAIHTAHNCGGEDSSSRRRVTSAEWKNVVSIVERANFDSLPLEIVKTQKGDLIEIVADDTIQCVAIETTQGERKVCGGSYAIENTTEGAALIRIIRAIAILRRTTPN